MTPVDPLSLQCIDRIVTVLGAITAGDDYHYTPIEVLKEYLIWRDATLTKDKPLYMVSRASAGVITQIGEHLYEMEFYISVQGYVQDPSDAVTRLCKAIRDIQKAINDDSKSEAAGTLGALAAAVTMEESPETDNGYFSPEDVGWFDQRIRIRIDGDFGEL